jgi:hypothetical protein
MDEFLKFLEISVVYLSKMDTRLSTMANFDPEKESIREVKFDPTSNAVREISKPNKKKPSLGSLKLSDVLPEFGSFAKGVGQGAAQTFYPKANFLNPEESSTTPAEIGKGIGSILPYVGADIAGPALLARMAPSLAARAVPSAISSLVPQAGVGALQNRDYPIMGALLAGLTGATGHAAAHALSKIPGAFSRFVSGKNASGAPMSADQYAAEMASQPKELSEIGMPLGEEARSGHLNTLYNTLGAVPFSGAREPYQKLSDILSKNKSDILESTGSHPEADNAFYEKLKEGYLNQVSNTRDAYKKVDELASSKEIPFKNDAYKEAYSNVIEDLKDKMSGPGGKSTWKSITDLVKDYSPKKGSLDSFSSARQVEANLNEKLRQMPAPEAQQFSRYVKMLKKGLNQSMEDSSEGGGKEINDAIKYANNQRKIQGSFEKGDKNSKTPFFDVYWNNKDPAGIISKYIKPSQYGKDYSGYLSDVLSKVKPGEEDATRQIMASQYLSPKNEGEELSLGDLHKKLSSLNGKQRQILFSDKKGDVDKFVEMLNKHPRAKSADYVPQTGLTAGKVLGGLGAIGAAGAGYEAGEKANSPLLQYGAVPLALLGARGGVNLLRSNFLKNAYLNSLRNQGRGAGSANRLLQALLSSGAPAAGASTANYFGGANNGS